MPSIGVPPPAPGLGPRPWFEALTRLFAGIELVHGDGNEGSIEELGLGAARLWVVAAGAHALRHPLPSRCLQDRISVVVQVEGAGRVEQGGRACELSPGDLTLLDGSAPSAVEFAGPFRQILLVLPRRELSDLPLASATGRVMRAEHPVDGLLARTITGLPAALASLDPIRGDGLALALALMVRASSALQGGAEAVRRHVRIERAIALIERELGDPMLSPAGVAAAQGVGRRHLDALFAAHGTSVERWIQERRLERAALALRTAPSATVLEIALAHGFRSASHFARAFRRRFGVAPRASRGEADSVPKTRGRTRR